MVGATFQFLNPIAVTKFQGKHPRWGVKMGAGIFLEMSPFISKMVWNILIFTDWNTYGTLIVIGSRLIHVGTNGLKRP